MSVPYTVGVEEEYQVVAPSTWELRDGAADIIAADWGDELRAEMQKTTVEVGTAVCASASEVAAALQALRVHVDAVAASEGFRIAASGLHPFSRWESRTQTRSDRYRRIVERYGRISRDEHNFGMHVHVAVPDREESIVVLNGIRFFLPHMLALSASSPYFEGEDSGYASYRTILWRRWPLSGVPPRFASRDEYRRWLNALLSSGILGDAGSVYWSARLHDRYPTLEVRVTDVCPRLEDAVAIAAFTRAVVVALVEGRLLGAGLARPAADAEHELLSINLWQAARHGLDARVLSLPEGGTTVLRQAILELLDVVGPVAEALGDRDAIGGVNAILRRGNAAERMRIVHGERGSLREVAEWVVGETALGTGIDRRRAQRGAVG